jgi:F-type H+-transporting ATPase subunit a
VSASAMATAVMLLELFVAFLQAFVFMLLTAVFIGLMRAEH